jgi:hypothetical protein
MTDILNSERDKNKGRPLSSVWDEITRGNHVGSGKYQATCNYCNTTWSRGDVSKLEEHLANHCSEAPASIVRKYLNKVLEREDKVSKKRKIVGNNQLTITDYHDFTRMPNARVTRINRAIAKFFVACGISFQVIENPFFINFVKELNSAYELPTREYLSNQLLERELAMVNSSVTAIIEKGTNFTLGLLIMLKYFFFKQYSFK